MAHVPAAAAGTAPGTGGGMHSIASSPADAPTDSASAVVPRLTRGPLPESESAAVDVVAAEDVVAAVAALAAGAASLRLGMGVDERGREGGGGGESEHMNRLNVSLFRLRDRLGSPIYLDPTASLAACAAEAAGGRGGGESGKDSRTEASLQSEQRVATDRQT